MIQKMRQIGPTVVVEGPDPHEVHRFGSEAEAAARMTFVAEALTWFGTPFRNCADVKGPNGAVDCAMLLVRCSVDTGLLPPFDPRPYAPAWHLHRSEEKFIGWIEDQLGGVEVETPRLGDVVVWQFGRCYAHGGIKINDAEVIHAYAGSGRVITSRLDDQVLSYIGIGGYNYPRPVRYFDVWKGAR